MKLDGTIAGRAEFMCCARKQKLSSKLYLSGQLKAEYEVKVALLPMLERIQSFLPRMMAAGQRACIVNTASAAGLVSTPGMAAYNVSKQGVVTLSESLHHERRLAASPVHLAVLCPAWVPTGIGASERNRPEDCGQPQAPGAISAAIVARIGKAIASGHLSADDMADATFNAVVEDRFYVIPHRGINAEWMSADTYG